MNHSIQVGGMILDFIFPSFPDLAVFSLSVKKEKIRWLTSIENKTEFVENIF